MLFHFGNPPTRPISAAGAVCEIVREDAEKILESAREAVWNR